MALRYLEVRLPMEAHDEATELAESHETIEEWCVPAGNQELHRYLLDAERVEALTDAIRSRFGDETRIVIMPVEATVPRAGPEPDMVPVKPPAPVAPARWRVSREELHEDIEERITLNPVFATLAAVSAVVACIGLATNDTIALIGAMVIAPLLGPNVGLALASTLGNLDLGKKALKSGLVGIGISFVIALVYGYYLGAPESAAIDARVQPNMSHIVLALASGVAGGLAFTTGVPASLIGVMVAVALLPPLATGGMLLGAGQGQRSVGAFLLLGINLVAVNLAGVATFLAQGIRPIWESEKQKARQAAIRAIVMWASMLAILAAAILWIQAFGGWA